MTNMTITGLIKYMVVVVGTMAKGIINDYKTKVEVLVEVHFKVITKKYATFVKNRITSQLGILLISERRYIISFAKVQETSEIVRLLRLTSKIS